MKGWKRLEKHEEPLARHILATIDKNATKLDAAGLERIGAIANRWVREKQLLGEIAPEPVRIELTRDPSGSGRLGLALWQPSPWGMIDGVVDEDVPPLSDAMRYAVEQAEKTNAHRLPGESDSEFRARLKRLCPSPEK